MQQWPWITFGIPNRAIFEKSEPDFERVKSETLKVRWTQCLRNEGTIKSPFEKKSLKPRFCGALFSRFALDLVCSAAFQVSSSWINTVPGSFLKEFPLNEYLNSFFNRLTRKKTEKFRPKRARLNGKKMTKKNFETKISFEKRSSALKWIINC